MNIPVHGDWAFGGILFLVGAILLSLGGIGLVLYSARMTREAVSRRVDLIRGNVSVLARAVPPASALIRSGPSGTKGRERREAARLLAKFGVPAHQAASIYTALRLSAVVALALVGFIAASHWSLTSGSAGIWLLMAMSFGIIGWFLPSMIIGKLIKRHIKSIVSGLPDALELLVICVQAGLSFEDGIDRVAGVLEQSQPALAEELILTSADLKILPSREQALANLAVRVDMPSVRSVVTTLSQTLRYGTPLAQALRVVSSELRNDTLVRLEERANQLPTLMTIPMMLFIMPTIFMIVAGPAALRVMDTFKH
jgi:tight adherence protein C